jgi:uncharacterized RDD family membrane protein YckC
VKCPKCDYLGFETGDRCKNCGYDFSLLAAAEAEPAEYDIHPASIDDVPIRMIDDEVDDVLGDTFRISIATNAPLEEESRLEHGADVAQSAISSQAGMIADRMALGPSVSIDEPIPAPGVIRFAAAPTAPAGALPLFTPAQPTDDAPLIKLPVAPRPPLAVRRTPDTPRLRAVPARRSLSGGGPRPVSRPSHAPVLEFPEEVEPAVPVQAQSQPHARVQTVAVTRQPGRSAARVAAVLIDYVILFGIDAAVVYFTVRMAGLSAGEWRLLPVAPMAAFLGLLKVAYFYAFTAVGGQTIGKMATGTCVVTDNGGPVDAARAMRRTSAGALSFLLLGVGFVPALFRDGRALHDRLAGTRVIRLRSV